VLFAIVYRFLPQCKIEWADVWLGATITGCLFVAGKLGLTVYFRFAVVRNAYGAAGSVAAILIWIYYSAMLIFLGAAFTRVYAESKGKTTSPKELAQSLVDRP
jgi:membrane protein